MAIDDKYSLVPGKLYRVTHSFYATDHLATDQNNKVSRCWRPGMTFLFVKFVQGEDMVRLGAKSWGPHIPDTYFLVLTGDRVWTLPQAALLFISPVSTDASEEEEEVKTR